MAFKVRNKDEAEMLITALEENRIKPEARDAVIDGIQRFGKHFQQIQRAKAEGRGSSDPAGENQENALTRGLNMIGERAIGNTDAMMTFLSSVVAEPVAGISGAATLLFTKGDTDAAAGVTEIVRDAYTWQPRTSEGEAVLESIAAPLKALDDGADWIATTFGLGNPLAQAAIYTALLGGTEVLSLKGGAVMRAKATRNLKKLNEQAADMGVSLKQTEMPASIVEAAARLTPEQRFARTAELQEAMQLAEHTARTAKRKAEGIARAREANVQAKDVKDFSRGARENLQAEFDLTGSDMKVVTQRLDELDGITTRKQAVDSPIELPPGVKLVGPSEVDLRSIQTVHDRISKTLLKRKRNQNTPRIIDENIALVNLQKQLDGFLDAQFNKDLIRGDADALAKWRQAGEVRQKYNKMFHEDRTIKQFINAENTPGEVHRFLMGANAVNAKPQAARVLRRMKEILGPDSPAIRGLKQEVTFDLAKPLLQDHPNFESFVRGVDNFVANNGGKGGLITELGMDMKEISSIRNFAAAALDIPGRPGLFDGVALTKNISRLLWGHGIAKAGVRVNMGTAALSLLARKNKLTQKQMIFAVGEAMFNEPMVSRTGVNAARIIQSVALADMQRSGEREDR
jgi:hypothetical protein